MPAEIDELIERLRDEGYAHWKEGSQTWWPFYRHLCYGKSSACFDIAERLEAIRARQAGKTEG